MVNLNVFYSWTHFLAFGRVEEVFKPAVEHLSVAIIVVQNHPSGDTEPSETDILLTGRLGDAGKLPGIEVADHLVITGSDFRSIL